MSFLTFPVTGNYQSLAPGGVIKGKVKFTSNIVPGVPPHGVTGGVTYGILNEAVYGIIDNGILKPTSSFATLVTLTSNDVQLNLTHALQYTVTFYDVTVDGQPLLLDPFTFNAPSDGTAVDLLAVSPTTALQIVAGLPVLPTSGLSDATTFSKAFLTGVTSQGTALTYLGAASPASVTSAVATQAATDQKSLTWAQRHPGTHSIPAARTTYYDKADTAYASLPTTMDTGQTGVAYADNGTEHPFIASGAFQLPRRGSSGQAFQYSYVDAGAGNQLTRIGYTFKVDPTGSSTDTWAIGLAIANGPTLNYGGTAYRIGVHLSISATGWGVTKASNATGTLVNTTLASGFFPTGFILEDGMSEYTTDVWRVGNTTVIITPDGTRTQITDTDIGTWATEWGYIELVMVAGNTDPFPKFTEFWYDTNGITLPGQGGIVTRDIMDANTKPKLATIEGTLGNPVLRIADNANAVNYLVASNRIAGSPGFIQAEGADADINVPFLAKGKGRIIDAATGRPFAQLASGATVLTTNTAPTKGVLTRYNCTTGAANLNVTLPALSTLVDGDMFPVEKYSGDATTFTITFTCAGADSFDDSVTTTEVLRVPGQVRYLQVFSIGGALHWKVVGGNTPLTSLWAQTVAVTNKDLSSGTNTFPTFNQSTSGNAATATTAAACSGNAATATKWATARNIDGVSIDGSGDIGLGGWTPAASGFIAWTFDPMMCYVGATAFTAGVLVLAAVRIPKATTVTNVILNVMTAGSGLTSGQNFACLYQGGNLLAATADQTTPWQSTGLKTMALTAPQSVSAGLAYVGAFCNGTTRPQFAAPIASQAAGNLAAINAVMRSAFDSHTSLTTAPPASLGTLTSTTAYWAAVS
jgi:hypothetical protein